MAARAQAVTIFADGELVRLAARGDRTAFGRIYERYARVVHGILLARVAPADAEDLLQDVFLTAMNKLSGLREVEAFPGWLAAIARHRATDHLRGQRQCVALEDDGRLRSLPRETFAALDAIRSLPEAYRETLALRLVEGMTGPEIAERTGLTPESVRVNLCRGMKLLRERMGGAQR